jgi:1-acyl-sn-glycerol-3-phosphate acyltransferase
MKLLSLTNISKNFNIVFINKNSIDADKQYLYALHPHGMITISKLLHFSDIKSPLYPYWKNSRHAAHSVLFMIPIIRELGLFFHSIPVGKSYLQYYINKGYSITLYPGGAREIQYSEENLSEDYVYLKNRKGFLKLCQKNNLPIVPVYGWNEQNIFTYKSHFYPINKFLSKLLGFTTNIDIFQIFSFENLYKLLKIFMGEKEPTTILYVGEPFIVDPEESIDNIHERYIEEIKKLYMFAARDQKSDRKLVIE